MNFREEEEKIAWYQSSNERKEMVSFTGLQRVGKNKDYFFSKGDSICIFIKTDSEALG